MSRFLDVVTSHQFQLAATAIISGATAVGLVLGYQTLREEERLSELKSSIPSLEEHQPKRLTSFGASSRPADKEDAHSEALARRALAGDYDEELVMEQLARNRVFLGDEGLSKVRNAFVIVVGLGGVGSHCTASLARSGVTKLRLVDFDQVSLSSLNRHAVATLADVGVSKVRCLQKRLMAITPWCEFDLRQDKFDADVAEQLLGPWSPDGQRPDFVVDCIDNIDTKVTLLKYCHDNKLPVISAAGAGCKSDVTRLMIGDISGTTDDPLSRSTRRKLKLRGVTSGIPVCYSVEKAGEGKAELLPLPEAEFQKGDVGQLGALPGFRVRILPVIGTMPAMFGYAIANHIILSLADYPLRYSTSSLKFRDKLYDGSLAYLQGTEERLVRIEHPEDPDVGLGYKLPITPSDASFLVDEVYRGRSAISGIGTKLVLIRWKLPDKPLLKRIGSGKDEQKWSNIRLSDITCMTKEESTRHFERILKDKGKLEDLYEQDIIDRVETRLREVAVEEVDRL